MRYVKYVYGTKRGKEGVVVIDRKGRYARTIGIGKEVDDNFRREEGWKTDVSEARIIMPRRGSRVAEMTTEENGQGGNGSASV